MKNIKNVSGCKRVIPRVGALLPGEVREVPDALAIALNQCEAFVIVRGEGRKKRIEKAVEKTIETAPEVPTEEQKETETKAVDV